LDRTYPCKRLRLL